MSNVDERVVKMTFDNKSFERNAQETMSTLDKLKSALKFNHAEKTFDKITDAAKKVDVSNISNGVEKVKMSFSAMQIVGITAISRLTNSLMNFAHKTVSKIWAQTVQGGIRRAFNIEKAKFTIEGLGKSFALLKDDINYAVTGTAYGFDEAAVAASSMAASNVKAGKEMKQALRGISGMAAMTGSSYSEIANIFTTVAGNSRLLTQQLNQFSSRGINAAATLRDYLNSTKDGAKQARDEMFKLLASSSQADKISEDLIDAHAKEIKALAARDKANGKAVKSNMEYLKTLDLTEKDIRRFVTGSSISFNTFSKAIDESFGEHAKAANKTFNGVMSNIKATLSRIGESFVHPLMENNTRDNMVSMTYDKYSNVLVKTAQETKAFRDDTIATRKELYKSIKGIKEYSGKSNSEIQKIYESNKSAFIKQVKQIPEFSKKSSKEIKTLLRTEAEEFAIRAKQLPEYANMSEGHLKKVYEKYKNIQFNVVGVLQGVKRVFGAIESGIKNSKFLQDFLTFAERASKALILLTNGIAASLGDAEKGLEIIGKGGKSKFVAAEKIWNKFRKTLGLTKTEFSNLKDAFGGIKSIFGIIGDVIGEVIRAFVPAKGSMKDFRGSILEVAGAIGRSITAFRDWLKETGLVKAIVGALKTAFSILLLPIKLVISAFKLLFKGIKNLSKPFKQFGKLVQTLFGAFKKLGKAISDPIKKIIEAFLKPFSKESDNANKSGGRLSDILKKVAGAVKWLRDRINGAADGIHDFITKFVNLDSVKKVGEKFHNVVTNKIGPAFKTVFDWSKKKLSGIELPDFGNMLSKASGNIKTGMSGFKLPNIGEAILNGLENIKNINFSKYIDNIKTGFGNFIDFLGDVKDKIGETFQKIWDSFDEKNISFSGLTNSLVDGITKAINAIAGMGTLVIGAIGQLFTSIFNSIGEHMPSANSFGIALGDFFASAIKHLVSLIPYLVELLSTAVRTLVSHLPSIIVDLANGIKGAFKKGLFEPIEIEVNGVKREIPPLFDGISEAVHSIGEKFKNAEIDDILNWINKLLTAGVLNQLRKLLKANRQIPKDLGDFLEGLGKSVDKKLNPGLTQKFQMFADAIMTLVKSLAILAGTLVVLSYIPDDKLKKGGIALGALALGLVAFSGALALINKYTDNGLATTLQGLGSVMAGISSLIGVLMALTLVKKGMARSLGILAAIFIELGLFIFALKKIAADPGELQGIANSLGGFIDAIKSLTLALVVMAQIPAVKMYNAIVELGLVMTELGLLIFAMSKIPVTSGLKTLVQLIPMIAMLGIMIGTLALIKHYDLDPTMLQPIGTCLLMIGATIKILEKINPGSAASAALSVLAFVGTILGIVAIVGTLINYVNEKMNGALLEQAKAGLETMGDLLRWLGNALGQFVVGIGDAITGAMPTWGSNVSGFFENITPGLKAIGEIPKGVGKNIQSIADAISILVGTGIKESLASFFTGETNFADFGTRFGELIAEFEKIAKALSSKKSNINEDSLEKIKKVADVVKELSKIETELQSQGGLKAGVFGSKSFGKFASGIKKLFAGFAEISKTAGEIKNVEQIQKLSGVAKALSDCMASLPDEKTGMFWMDMAGTSKLAQFGKDLIAFSADMATYVSNIKGIDTAGMSDVVSSIKDSLNSLASTKIKGMKAVGKSATKDLTSGFSSKAISKALNSAMSNATSGIKVSGFKTVGTKAVKAFAGAISKSEKPKSAGEKAADNVESGLKTLDISGIATNCFDGFSSSFLAKGWRALGVAAAKKVNAGFADTVESHSPARVWMQFADNLYAGFGMHMRKNMSGFRAQGAGAANAVNSSFRKSLSFNSAIGGVDSQPTIRPVLDLSDVKMGLNSMDSMFGSNRYALGIAGSMNVGAYGRGASSMQNTRNVTFNNNITVDGAEDPAQWADEFAHELEIQARTR